MTRSRPTILIADACVLIDYGKAGRLDIVATIAAVFSPIIIPRDVFDEVEQLADHDVARLGLEIIVPTLEQYSQVCRPRALSAPDQLCCLVAEACQGAVWTNEKLIHRYCRGAGIPSYWGIGILVDLVQCRIIQTATALEIASDLQQANPAYITEAIMQRFRKQLDALRRKHP